eukprot:symbB.v1.2.026512.t1/scaffold2652.1/size73958/4
MSDPIRMVKPQQLVENFEQNYGSFLEGLLAEHGAPQATPMCGTTLKSFTQMAWPRPHFEVDFENNYRPSSRRGRPEREAGGSPNSLSARGPRISVSQVAESPFTARENGSRATLPRFTAIAITTPRGRGKDFGRETTAEVLETAKDDDEARRREACESLRTLILGPQTLEHSPEKEKEWIAQHRRGSDEEVESFCQSWCQMDADSDGTVDLDEFSVFFSKRKVDRLLGMRCVRYLTNRSGAQNTAKPYVTRGDMMHLMWPYASLEDMDHMCTVFDHCRLRVIQVPKPRALPRKRKTELLKCFQDMDRKKLGSVPFLDLIPAGIAEENMVKVLREKYDRNSRGTFDQECFLEMMAPLGYQAHDSMTVVVCKDGKRVRAVQWSKDHLHFEGWLTDWHFDQLKEHYGFDEEIYPER